MYEHWHRSHNFRNGWAGNGIATSTNDVDAACGPPTQWRHMQEITLLFIYLLTVDKFYKNYLLIHCIDIHVLLCTQI